ERIIQVLAGFGYSPSLRGTALPDRSQEFLCFGRGDDFDVVLGAYKVLGSAQRRRKGAVLQHGSLLLRSSAQGAAFPGLFDCGGYSVPECKLLEMLAPALGALFGAHFQIAGLTAEEADRATRLSVA